MFSAFPDGWAGVGLVLLRTTVGAVLFAQSVSYLANWRDGIATPLIAALMALSGTLLFCGYMTRYAAVAAALLSASSIFSRFTFLSFGLFETRVTPVLAIVIAIAILCLGPGAFSLDARFFGRREIIIPKTPSNA